MGEEEHKLAWSALQSLKELKRGFHLIFQETGAAFIPYRAFADGKEQRLWGARTRLYLVKKADY